MFTSRKLKTIVTVLALSTTLTACTSVDRFGVNDRTIESPDFPEVSVEPPSPEISADSVAWDEAFQLAGTVQRVCGPVASTGNSDNDFFVNLGHAYPDTRRFQFVFWDVGGLPELVQGEQVCAEGEIVPYEEVFEMELYSLDSLEIVN